MIAGDVHLTITTHEPSKVDDLIAFIRDKVGFYDMEMTWGDQVATLDFDLPQAKAEQLVGLVDAQVPSASAKMN